ncbi:hypothetical protein OAL24_00841 [Oenococcus sicerae]|nr:hypothetical protein OAL24_00841 [Oenococcus sicerae]
MRLKSEGADIISTSTRLYASILTISFCLTTTDPGTAESVYGKPFHLDARSTISAPTFYLGVKICRSANGSIGVGIRLTGAFFVIKM